MLNKTLFGLTLHGIALASPYLSQQFSISLINANIRNSATTFAYNLNHLYVRGSQFTNFLDSAISINRENQVHRYDRLYNARPEQPTVGDEIDIENAYFFKCVSRSDGGAIFYNSPDSGTLSIKQTTFSQCHSGPNPADGGCVSFNGLQSIILTTCASQCSAGRNGHSFCIQLSTMKDKKGKTSLSKPNHLNQSSIIECSPKESARGWQSLYLSSGQIRIIDLNSSYNAVATQSGSLMMHTMDSDAICLHSTICSNIGPWIIYLYGKEGSLIQQSNIVNNICVSRDQHGIVMFHKFGRIDSCIFSGNQGKLFAQNNEKASIQVTNCVADTPYDHEPGVETSNCVFEQKDVQTFVLAHLQTENCMSKRDVLRNPIGTNEIFSKLKLYFHGKAQAILNWIK